MAKGGAVLFNCQPRVAGETLANHSVAAGDPMVALDFIDRNYSHHDDRGAAIGGFLAALPTLTPEVVSRVTRHRIHSKVSEVLLDRFDELEPEVQARLLRRNDRDLIWSAVRRHVIGRAPAEVQREWATSDDVRRRHAVLADPKVETELRELAIANIEERVISEGKLSSSVFAALVNHVGEEVVERLLTDRRIDAGDRYSIRFRLLGNDAEQLAAGVKAWTRELAEIWPFPRNRALTPEERRVVVEMLDLSKKQTWYALYANHVAEAVNACGVLLPKVAAELTKVMKLEQAAYGVRAKVEAAEKVAARLDPEAIDSLVAEDLADRANPDGRSRVLEEGSMEAVAEMFCDIPPNQDELEILKYRFFRGGDSVSVLKQWEELDRLMAEKAPKTPNLGVYWKLRSLVEYGSNVRKWAAVLRVEDLAALTSVGNVLLHADAGELKTYLDQRGVGLAELLGLWSQIGDLKMDEAIAVLSDQS